MGTNPARVSRRPVGGTPLTVPSDRGELPSFPQPQQASRSAVFVALLDKPEFVGESRADKPRKIVTCFTVLKNHQVFCSIITPTAEAIASRSCLLVLISWRTVWVA